jgi:hypothetical protein
MKYIISLISVFLTFAASGVMANEELYAYCKYSQAGDPSVALYTGVFSYVPNSLYGHKGEDIEPYWGPSARSEMPKVKNFVSLGRPSCYVYSDRLDAKKSRTNSLNEAGNLGYTILDSNWRY